MSIDNDMLNKKRVELDLPTRPSAGTLILGAQGELAGEPGHELAKWLANTFNKNFSEYDSAIDSIYNASHIGGSRYHHLIDGQHDIFGAFQAAHGVKADDVFAEEALGALEHLARDTASIAGINPFMSLTTQQFNQVANTLSTVGIPKSYFVDAMLVNSSELVGGAIGLCGAIFMKRKIRDGYSREMLSRLSGGCLLSSVISANPVLLPVAAYGMYSAIKESDNKKDAFMAAGNGAFVSGSALMVSSLIGGPIWLGCVAGMVAASLVAQGLTRSEKVIGRAQDLVASGQEVFRRVQAPIARIEIPV